MVNGINLSGPGNSSRVPGKCSPFHRILTFLCWNILILFALTLLSFHNSVNGEVSNATSRNRETLKHVENLISNVVACIKNETASFKLSSSTLRENNCLEKEFLTDVRNVLRKAYQVEMKNEQLFNENQRLKLAHEEKVEELVDNNESIDKYRVNTNLIDGGHDSPNPCQEKNEELAWLKGKFLNNSNWDTELHLAVNDKDDEAIRKLIQAGAYINARNRLGETPLFRATVCQDFSVCLKLIIYFIENGADVYAKDNDDRTFLHNMVGNGSTLTSSQFDDVVSYLLYKNLWRLFNTPGWTSGGTPTPLLQVVKLLEVDTSTLSQLYQNGANFSAVSEGGGDSILSFAIQGNRSINLMSDLIAFGADWTHLNMRGQNLLHFAAQSGHVEGLNYFLNLGLDINALDENGNTPIHLVILSGSRNFLETISFLIQNGADVTTKNKMGRTPLEEALHRNDMIDKKNVIQLLKDSALRKALLDSDIVSFE